MSIFDSSPLLNNGQKVPSKGAKSCRQCGAGKLAKGLEICHTCANGAIKALHAKSDIPAEEDTPTFEGGEETAATLSDLGDFGAGWHRGLMTEPKVFETTANTAAAVLAMVAPHLSHDRVAVASDGQTVRGARVSPETDIELIEMRGTYGYWVHWHGASIGEVRTAIKDGWWTFCVKGDLIFDGGCIGNWQSVAKHRIAEYLHHEDEQFMSSANELLGLLGDMDESEFERVLGGHTFGGVEIRPQQVQQQQNHKHD
jgi:hypothetical protein